MHDANRWNPLANQTTAKTLPSPTLAPSLTASPDGVQPVASYAVAERIQPVLIAWHGVVVLPSLNYPAKPAADAGWLMVHPVSQFLLDLL